MLFLTFFQTRQIVERIWWKFRASIILYIDFFLIFLWCLGFIVDMQDNHVQ